MDNEMECRSRGMMRDRVTGLRRINFYEPQPHLHQISGLTIDPVDNHNVKCRSNYLVIRTTGDGAMTLYSAGVYLDKIVLNGEGAKFGSWFPIHAASKRCW